MEKEIGELECPKVGITLGDVNGIGPEVVLKALRDNHILSCFTPVIYGSTKVVSYFRKSLNLQEFNYHNCRNANDIHLQKVNIINVWDDEVIVSSGEQNAVGGKSALKSLESAVNDLANGTIDVLVTAPFSKDVVQKAGFEFPGHTEYLAHQSQVNEAMMVLVADELRVALVTTHLPLSEVPKAITKERLMEKLRQFNLSLKKDFNIVRPKIAVLGLNPHAGENGKLGKEENEIIIPAINAVKEEGILAFGPYPADSFFGSSARSSFDGILSMYHDQGLTGFKSLAFDEGVNFTAGLPIVRTSPDHGTAYDIAGKDLASENSMRKAMYLAVDVFRNRKKFKKIMENPLPFRKPNDKERDE